MQILVINLDQTQNKVKITKNTIETVNALYGGQELILKAFRSGIFPMKEKQGKWLITLTPKQMLERLTIALAQVKAGWKFTKWNQANHIFLSQAKEITEIVYNNKMNSITV